MSILGLRREDKRPGASNSDGGMGRLFERSIAVPATLEELQVRHSLLERLSQLQRSISHGAPLQDILSSIAAGAAELLGDPVAGVRLVDEHDPTTMRLIAATGLTPQQFELVRVAAVGQGAGGRAIAEGRVVVIEDYPATTDAIAQFGEFGVQNALAAPVRVDGRVAGSLTVASFEPGRRYSVVEQEILSALAEHAGLALSDASLIGHRERSAQREGEERFEALARNSSDLIAIVDPAGAISYATPSVGRVLGVGTEELIGSSLLAHVHPADRPDAARLLETAAGRPGTQPPADWQLVPAGTQLDPSRWMHVEVLATNLLENPSVRGIVINARDVTERVVAEQRRREQDALYRLIVDTTRDGVWVTDRDGRTVFANDALARMLGRPRAELHGRRAVEFMPPEQAQFVEAATLRRQRGESERYETVLLRDDGSALRVVVSATPIFEDGRFVGTLALCGDISELAQARDERIRLETRLRDSQLLESLGLLAGHVAHDFNQVLAVVRGFSELLLARTDEARDREDLGRIIDAADHGAALARQLVTFSRRDEGEPEVLNLADVVRATIALRTSTAPAGVVIAAETAEALPVRIDPTKLRQILMNLVDNAMDAIAGGGRLVVAARAVELRDDDRSLPAGAYAELCVRDDGAGMPPEVLTRALEPAFTTKPWGTGLGLAIVHGAVEAAGGGVTLRSEPECGTTVSVLLPLSTDPAAGPQPERQVLGDEPAATGTILLAEDDAAVLGLIARILTGHGYVVHACATPAGAAEIAAREPIDLLITDQTMPGGSGTELAAHIGELQPGTPVIVMSGYAAEAAPARPAGVVWLSKPFGAAALIRTVRSALDEASRRRTSASDPR